MEIIFKVSNQAARSITYFLQRRYKSKAGIRKLAKLAVLTEVANEAKKDILERGVSHVPDEESILVSQANDDDVAEQIEDLQIGGS